MVSVPLMVLVIEAFLLLQTSDFINLKYEIPCHLALFNGPLSDLADGPKPWSAEELVMAAILLFIFASHGDVTCGWVWPSTLAPGGCPKGVSIQCGGDMGEDSSSSGYQDQGRV